ncbi:hypothetical protein AVEN_253510-1 [Araneus ventricosus]|uniref:DUF4817 domain-containing protein n=1 Tax=Araneus ventricosus TaxID=182803 RepID=A0A4Y2BTA2_ARAVE|nr:hypothetical protein AVEN_253510-1 [Araneus ventricosus]
MSFVEDSNSTDVILFLPLKLPNAWLSFGLRGAQIKTKPPGNPRMVGTPEYAEKVRLAMLRNPRRSTRRHSAGHQCVTKIGHHLEQRFPTCCTRTPRGTRNQSC